MVEVNEWLARCDICGRESVLYPTALGMMTALHAEGWELYLGVVWCPNCNERGDLPEDFRIEVVEGETAMKTAERTI